jgi:hypothetical protein
MIGNNSIMGNTNHHSAATDATADAQVIVECLTAQKPVPAEVVRRVRERADQARKMLLAAHGLQDIGVQIIREIRGELPLQ